MSDTFNRTNILKIAYEELCRAVFKKTAREEIAIRVSGQDTGELLEGISYDDIQATYPSATIENYSYYLNEVLQATIEVTYSNASKEVLLRARKI